MRPTSRHNGGGRVSSVADPCNLSSPSSSFQLFSSFLLFGESDSPSSCRSHALFGTDCYCKLPFVFFVATTGKMENQSSRSYCRTFSRDVGCDFGSDGPSSRRRQTENCSGIIQELPLLRARASSHHFGVTLSTTTPRPQPKHEAGC